MIAIASAAPLSAQITTLTGGFTGTTLDAGWTTGGSGYSPILTAPSIDAAGNGWLRLTSSAGNEATYAYDTTSFTAKNATITTTFNYASYNGSGADGITFFLADASKTFGVGAYGGSMGYAQKTAAGGGGADINGMNGGYIGVGIDEFGNFSNPTEGRIGGTGFTPNAISVRGPGQGLTGYDYLGGTNGLGTQIAFPGSAARPTGANTRSIQVTITATNQMTVSMATGGSGNYVQLYTIDLSGYARPDNLIVGFTAGTGGSTDIHEIQNIALTSVVSNLWTNTSADSMWTTATNWNNTPAAVPPVGADILLDNTFVNTAQNIAVSGNKIIRNLQIDAPFSYNLSGGSLELNGSSAPGPTGIYVTQTHGSAAQTVGSNITTDNAVQIQNNSAGSLNLTGTVGLGANIATFSGSGATNVSGVVSGTGAIIQSGAGNTTLSGANTYSGGTTLSAGTLTANNNAGLGTGGLTITGGTLASTNSSTISNTISLQSDASFNGITSNGTLTQSGGNYTLNMANATQAGTVNLSNSNTGRTLTVEVDGGTSAISGPIQNGGSGAGSLTKTGVGTLTLGGLNTYTGTTTINAGIVQLGANNVFSDSSNVNIAGGTLNLNGKSDQIGNLTFSNSGKLDFGSTAGNNSFVFNNFNGPPTGVLTILNYVGPDSSNFAGTGDFLGTLTNNLSATLLGQIYFSGYGTGSVENNGNLTAAGNGLGNAYRITPTAVTWGYTWTSNGTNGNSHLWSQNPNWSGGATPPNGANPTNVFVRFGTGSQTAVTFDASSTVNALQFSAAAAAYTITDSGTHTLTLQNGTNVTYVQQQSANNQVLNPANIVIKNNAVFDVTGTGNLTVGAVIDDGSSTFSLTKTGNGGRLILTGANGYNGGTAIQSGIVQAGNATALGSGAAIVSNGGALELTGGIVVANAVTTSGTGVGGNGSIDNVSGNNGLSSVLALAADSTVKSESGTLTLSGGVNGTNTNLTLTGAGNITLSAAIATGAGNLTLNGAGTTTFSGNANTSTGNTTVNAGTVNLSKAANTISVAGSLTINAGIVNETASGQIASASVVSLNGGTFAMAASTTQSLQSLNSSAGTTVSLGSGSTLTVSSSGSNTLNGTVTGAGALNMQGTGNTTLSSANSYSGGTTIASVVTALNNSSLGTGAVAVNSGGNLQVQGGVTVANNFTVSSTGTTAVDGAIENVSGNNTLSGNFTAAGNSRLQSDSGTLTLSGTFGLGGNSLNAGGLGNTTLSGVVSGTGGVTKDGAGLLLASAVNTYTGATAINAGTLQLGTNNALSSSTAVTIASGATFDVNGKTDTIASVAGAGTLAIGSGALITGNAGSTTLSGPITGTGSLTKQGTGTLTVNSNISFGGNMTVTAGTLEFNSTMPSIAGTLTLGAGSKLLLTGSGLTVDTLHITGNTVIDFGTGGASILNASNFTIDAGATLTINGWNDMVDYFFAQHWTGATLPSRGLGPETQVTFTGFTPSQTAWLPYDSTHDQITPAPEPATYGAMLMGAALAFLGFRSYRRKSAAGT